MQVEFFGKLQLNVRQWAFMGAINLLLVAVLGTILRLKFVYPIPFLSYKFLLHSHSHFAFVGWVSQMLMLVLLWMTCKLGAKSRVPKKLNLLLWCNWIGSILMMFSFLYQGYGRYSIILSTISILISYVFAGFLAIELKTSTLALAVKRWVYAALFFLVFSSIGTFVVAFLMATGLANPINQPPAIHFFLHFQYNGWFLFSFIAVLLYLNPLIGISPNAHKWVFWIFVVTTFFLYLLGVNGIRNVLWIAILLTLSSFLQLLGWFKVLLPIAFKGKTPIRDSSGKIKQNNFIKLIAFLMCVKLIAQLLGSFPQIGQYVYGYRPFLIGYLHWVLLVLISSFLLILANVVSELKINSSYALLFVAFVCLALINSFGLLLQGISWVQSINKSWFAYVFVTISLLLTVTIFAIVARCYKHLSD